MLTKEHIEVFLDQHLQDFDFPSAYLGSEAGVIKKPWESSYPRVCVVGGGSYLNLAGNLAVGLVTQLLNEMTPALAHRAFFPNSRKEYEKMKDNAVPMFGIEEKRPLSEYDLLACSCSYPGTDFNILAMLLMSGIDPYNYKRKEEDPIILRGGATFSCVDNFADMYDLVFVGEAEEALPKFIEFMAKYRKQMTRDVFITSVAREMPGFAAPGFIYERYDEKTKWVSGWSTRKSVEWQVPLSVKRVYVHDISKAYIYTNQILNYVDPGFSAGNLLVSRGCHTKCLFCGEGYTNLPYRDLPADIAVESIKKAVKASGAPQGLMSAFCSSSYAYKKQVVSRLLKEGGQKVDFISQRVDECAKDKNFVYLTGIAGNDTVSLGVESGSDRGRRAVNKHCLAKGTLVFTERGPVEIEKCINTVVSVDGSNVGSSLLNQGFKSCVRLELRGGYSLDCTSDHKVMVYGSKSPMISNLSRWVEVQYLKEGDCVKLFDVDGVDCQVVEPTQEHIVGYMLGDGFCNEERVGLVFGHCSHQNWAFLKSAAVSLVKRTKTQSRYEGLWEHTEEDGMLHVGFSSKGTRQFFGSLGMFSRPKRIPEYIMTGTLRQKIILLSWVSVFRWFCRWEKSSFY